MTARGQVTGNYAGPVTRLLAYLADTVIVSVTFGFFAAIAGFAARFAFDAELDIDRSTGVWWIAAIVVYAAIYMWIGLVAAGRTFGKSIVGLRVVARDGSPLEPRAATIRVFAFPLSFLPLGLGFIGIVIDRERRALHDLLARSAVVYDWGERPAELPAPLSRWIEQHRPDPPDERPTSQAAAPEPDTGARAE
jgi:uncharacterized RDD family membrane protein YckC